MRNRTICRGLAALAMLSLPVAASAQYIMVPDSTADKVLLFSKTDGSLVNANFILDANGSPYNFDTPKEAFQVGNEIWVTDQVADSIFRFSASLTPTYIGTISGGLDNIRGGGVVNGRVYISNAGTNNGAGGNSVKVYEMNGTFVTSFPATTGPFDCEGFEGDLLISDFSNYNIYRFATDGTQIGIWYDPPTGGMQAPQQICTGPTGPAGATEVWIAAFTAGRVTRLTSAGTLVAEYLHSGARGVALLDNGNVMVTSGAGVFTFTPGVSTPSLVAAGGVQYASPLNLGATACNAADIATAGNPDPQAGPDGFLTGDDFDLFINAFFNELRRTSNNTLIADMVDGDGNPPPDGFLTGSDFDYFLSKFFQGC